MLDRYELAEKVIEPFLVEHEGDDNEWSSVEMADAILAAILVAQGQEGEIERVQEALALRVVDHARIQRLTEALEEVRKRVIGGFSTGTAENSPHWWTCRLCEWTWRDGKPEEHEETCPMKARAALEAGGPGAGALPPVVR